MNRISLALLLFILLGCGKNESAQSEKDEVIHNLFQGKIHAVWADTLWISPQSRIFWKGTKMRGLGKHEGELKFEAGYFLMPEEQPVTGHLTANMKSIQVTDIPESDPIPLKELTDHLKGADFFDVDNFPKAYFELVSFTPLKVDSWAIMGNLEIKGISKTISFEGTRHAKGWTAQFLINRFDWNIAYTGSWANRTLVDPEIELRIELIVEQ